MSNWISVEDRDPEPYTPVLLLSKTGLRAVGWWDLEEDVYQTGVMGETGCSISKGYFKEITHWMPLPKPPEEVSNNA